MFFQDHIIRVWEDIVAVENKNSGDALKAICVQRITRLKKLQKRLAAEQDCFSKYASKTMTWLYGIKVCSTWQTRKMALLVELSTDPYVNRKSNSANLQRLSKTMMAMRTLSVVNGPRYLDTCLRNEPSGVKIRTIRIQSGNLISLKVDAVCG